MVEITKTTRKGGCVQLNKKHGVWASYCVARVGNFPPPEILYAGAELKDGRRIQFFFNRETGLVVVNIIDKDEEGGVEILRRELGDKA